jgi:hypothetical protein
LGIVKPRPLGFTQVDGIADIQMASGRLVGIQGCAVHEKTFEEVGAADGRKIPGEKSRTSNCGSDGTRTRDLLACSHALQPTGLGSDDSLSREKDIVRLLF